MAVFFFFFFIYSRYPLSIVTQRIYTGNSIVYVGENGGGSGGLSAVVHDATLTGDGTATAPLSVVDVSDNQDTWYLDTQNGSDSSSGLKPDFPMKTTAAIVAAKRACPTASAPARLVIKYGSLFADSGRTVTFDFSSDANPFPFWDICAESYREMTLSFIGVTFANPTSVTTKGRVSFNGCTSYWGITVDAFQIAFDGNENTFRGQSVFNAEYDVAITHSMELVNFISINCKYLNISASVKLTGFIRTSSSDITINSSGYFFGDSCDLYFSCDRFSLPSASASASASVPFQFPSVTGYSVLRLFIKQLNYADLGTTPLASVGAASGATMDAQVIVDDLGASQVVSADPSGTLKLSVVETKKIETAGSCVSYSTQSKTDTQKGIARSNIGVYSTAEVDAVIESQVASVIKSKGSATVAQINALTGMKDGWLYNLSDSGTITLGGFSVRAGDNIRWMDEDGVWDMYQSPTDFSEYYKKSEVDALAYKVKTSGTDLEGKLLTDKVSATGLVAKTIVNVGTADEKINLDVTPVIDATLSGSGTAGAPFGVSNSSFYVKGNSVYGGTLTNNLDTLERNTPFTCYGTSVGAPDTTHSWFGWHINSNAGVVSASQMAIAFGTDLIVKYRTKSASVWGPWRNGSTIVNN